LTQGAAIQAVLWIAGSIAVGFLSAQVLFHTSSIQKLKFRKSLQVFAFTFDLAKGIFTLALLQHSNLDKSYNMFLVNTQPFGLGTVERGKLFFGVINGYELEPLLGVLSIAGFFIAKRIFTPSARVSIPAVAIGVTLGCVPHLTLPWLLGFLGVLVLIGNRQVAFAVAPIAIPIGALQHFTYCIKFKGTGAFGHGTALMGYTPSILSFCGWVLFALLLVIANWSTIRMVVRGELRTYWNWNRLKTAH